MIDYVRRMRREDAERVLEIDREAFPTEWPPPNFRRELDNRLAHYIVACRAERVPEETPDPEAQRKSPRGLLARLRRLIAGRKEDEQPVPASRDEEITGFAGFWVMADEAHITSIATRESLRHQGIGEMMLQSVIDMAASQKARIVTLEVRVSNAAAQGLYTKYGFKHVGLRKGYYSDNREDAIVMSTDAINSPAFRALIQGMKQAYQQRWGKYPGQSIS